MQPCESTDSTKTKKKREERLCSSEGRIPTTHLAVDARTAAWYESAPDVTTDFSPNRQSAPDLFEAGLERICGSAPRRF